MGPKVTVVSHAYNGPGRMVPFIQVWAWANVQLIGPRRHIGGHLSSESGAGAIDVRPLRSAQLVRAQFVLWGVTRSLRQFRPDVILVEYDPWQIPYLQTRLASFLARTHAVVVTVAKKNTFRAPSSPLGRFKVWATNRLLRETPAIVAVSDRAKQMYVSVFDVEPSTVLVQPHMAVDTVRFSPRVAEPGDTVTVGFVGKVNETKGVPDLLDAFDVLSARHPGRDVRLLLVGQCDDAEIKARVAQNEAIELLGPVHNDALPELLHLMDVFVMPTQILPDHEEHDGRAVLEAMSSGLPCVVSSSGILPELVGRQEGRVYRAGVGQLLVEALEEVVFDPVLRARLGSQARQRVVGEAGSASLATMRRKAITKALERQPIVKDGPSYTAREEYLAPDVVDEYLERRFSGRLGAYRNKCEQAGVNALIERVERAGGARRILDCPTGIGRWLPNLLLLVPKAVTGVDVSPTMLAKARTVDLGSEVETAFIEGVAEALPFADDSFDLVFCHALLKHLPVDVQAAVISELARVSGRHVIVTASVNHGLSGFVRRFRRARGAVALSPAEFSKAVEASGLHEIARERCSTPIGVEYCHLLVKSDGPRPR